MTVPHALKPLFAAGDRAWEKVDEFVASNTFPLVEGGKGRGLKRWLS